MGEIDTKPIESVQTAITFFGHTNNEQRKNSPTNDKEGEIERDRESLERELASVKVQLEVKEAAYSQTLLKLDHYKKTSDELSTLLKNSDLKKNFYINESQKAGSRVTDLESALERMSYQLSEHEKVREQLESTRGEVALLRETKVESTSQMQAMERLLSEEKLHNEELSRQVSDTNKAITRLETERIQIERSYAEAFAAKEAEKLDLDNQVLAKSSYIESLHVEIKRADELRMSSERAASDAVSELSKLREEIELHEKTSLDQASYISLLEAEVEQIRREIGEANGEATRLKEHIESLKMELEKSREQENEAQVEIALLKFQLHKGRSRLAAAEAAEARAQGEKTALYNALQQMGLEAEETKKENRMLKEEAIKLANQEEDAEEEEEEDEMANKKGEDLSNESEEEKQIYGEELENMKRELEVAVSKIGELRTRAEQAISRAQAAEKAKAALEEEKKKRREQRERRKAALEALRQESISREFEIEIKDDDEYEDAPAKIYQPLAKVLNMKF